MTERRNLGRGLGALIPMAPTLDLTDSRAGTDRRTGEADPVAARYREVPPEIIRANPQQPRKIFDEAAHAELVHSVREIGLLQPIVVRPVPPGSAPGVEYEIVAGERRWRACKEAGVPLVPVIVRHTTDDALLQESLLENLHRANLNPLEEGAAYNQLLHDFDCTQEQLATRLGRSRSQVANSIRLLRLPTAVQRRVAAGVLSAGHARALLGLSDTEAMDRLATRIVAEGLSVRDVEEIVAVGARQRKTRTRTKSRIPVEYQAAADRLSERLETRVVVSSGAKRGRIMIDFGDVEDLARIIEAIEAADAGTAAPGTDQR